MCHGVCGCCPSLISSALWFLCFTWWSHTSFLWQNFSDINWHLNDTFNFHFWVTCSLVKGRILGLGNRTICHAKTWHKKPENWSPQEPRAFLINDLHSPAKWISSDSHFLREKMYFLYSSRFGLNDPSSNNTKGLRVSVLVMIPKLFCHPFPCPGSLQDAQWKVILRKM